MTAADASDDLDTTQRNGSAVVWFGTDTWALPVGRSLTFGRSSTCDIMIGGRSEDLLVSRHAGTLTCVAGGVLVTNTSSRHPLVLQAVPGPEFEIQPGMTIGTMPHRTTRVQVLGQHGARYLLRIDAHNLLGQVSFPGPPPQSAAGGVPTTAAYRRLDLTAAQRRYLTALCEPCLVRIGRSAAPASYKAIAERCGVSPRTVRNCLDQLRQLLATNFGIPGLVGEDDGQAGQVNYAAALARWAIDSDNVTAADVELLDR